MAAKNYLLISAEGFAGGPLGTGATRYNIPFGRMAFDPTDAALTRWTPVDSFIATNLYVRVTTNTHNAATVYTLQDAGVGLTNTVTFGAGVTGALQDTTHSDNLAVDDLINIKATTSSSSGASATKVQTVQLQASANVPVIGHCGAAALAANTTYYFSPVGSGGKSIVEAIMAYKINHNATLSDYHQYVYSNTVTAESTFRTRVNGGNGNQSLAVPALTTGLFKDAVNTDSLTPGDTFNVQIVVGATGTQLLTGDVHNYTLTGLGQIISASSQDVEWPGPEHSTDAYLGICDYSQARNTTESDVQCKAQFDCIFRDMYVYNGLYTLNAAATLNLSVNGADSALEVTVNATGIFQDTTHEVVLVGTDLLTSHLDTNDATAGEMCPSYVGYTLYQPPAPETKSANMGAKMIAGRAI